MTPTETRAVFVPPRTTNNHMLTLIGIAGRMGSGKDAVADVLCGEYGFIRMSFAEPLRRELCRELLAEDFTAEYPLSIQALLVHYHRNLEAVYAKPTETGIRKLLQWWGTEFRRRQDPYYWIKQADRLLPEHGKYVYTDLRFQNEADFIGKRGGLIWMVQRPSLPPPREDDHHSERWCLKYSNYDQLIVNDGTLADLTIKVRRAMSIPIAA